MRLVVKHYWIEKKANVGNTVGERTHLIHDNNKIELNYVAKFKTQNCDATLIFLNHIFEKQGNMIKKKWL